MPAQSRNQRQAAESDHNMTFAGRCRLSGLQRQTGWPIGCRSSAGSSLGDHTGRHQPPSDDVVGVVGLVRRRRTAAAETATGILSLDTNFKQRVLRGTLLLAG